MLSNSGNSVKETREEEMEERLINQLAEAWKKRRKKSVWDVEEHTYISISGATPDAMEVINSEETPTNTTPQKTVNSEFNNLSPIQAYKLIDKFLNPLKGTTKRLKDGNFTIQVPREELELVVQVCQFGKIPVKVEKHTFLNRCRGTIRSRDTIQMGEEEIKEELAEYRVTRVTKKQYYDKEKKKKVYSGELLLCFDRETLPDSINLAYLHNIQVKQHEPNPRQCFNCWQIGNHGQDDCKEVKICGWCSETQHKEAGEPCGSAAKCRNCLGNHPNWDKKCPVYVKEKEIQKVKEINKIPYPRAKAIVEERINPNRREDHATVVSNNVMAVSDHQKIVNELNAAHKIALEAQQEPNQQNEIARLNAKVAEMSQVLNILVEIIKPLMKQNQIPQMDPKTTAIVENVMKISDKHNTATTTSLPQIKSTGPPPAYTPAASSTACSYGNLDTTRKDQRERDREPTENVKKRNKIENAADKPPDNQQPAR